jgi:hypothetical protein
MEQTTLPPLVSDEWIFDRVNEYTVPYRAEITRVTKEFRNLYEASRAEDAKLIAKLRAEREELLGALEGIMELAYSSRLDEALDEAREIMAKHKPE